MFQFLIGTVLHIKKKYKKGENAIMELKKFQFLIGREHPKVCVNLQTDVR